MNVTHSKARSVLQNLLHLYVEERKKKSARCSNSTAPNAAFFEEEEIMQSLYILIIVGFFGFLLFSLMLNNLVSKQRKNYTDYLYHGKFQADKRRPVSKDSLATIAKNVVSKPSNSGQHQNTDSCPTAAETPSIESVLRNV